MKITTPENRQELEKKLMVLDSMATIPERSRMFDPKAMYDVHCERAGINTSLGNTDAANEALLKARHIDKKYLHGENATIEKFDAIAKQLNDLGKNPRSLQEAMNQLKDIKAKVSDVLTNDFGRLKADITGSDRFIQQEVKRQTEKAFAPLENKVTDAMNAELGSFRTDLAQFKNNISGRIL